MIIHARKWMERLRFMLLFIALTFMLYHGLLLLTHFLEPAHKYKEPAGHAVKVFQSDASLFPDAYTTMGERLKLFYRIGE
ncbi:hypothetical protein PAESOLCIP111_01492 [Paenibacillus solanacearum]|uniref:DUF4227 family protein n=1 Tax=Paenibacillus solanacearum TaxID=2048548 RepID=A0A916NP58_9BACL|nr:DUF4227 family protein [Paenibacillus solanacearum]CAG7612169.1 hypothetical protein PAESOLCIP111_01492 [Paenibacillus solanacearum]